MNLAAMLRQVAQRIASRRYAQRRHAYQVRASSALSSMKNNLVRLLIADPVDRQRLLLALVRQLSSAVEAVRSDRTFPRHNPGQLKPGFHASYKRLA